MEVKVKEVVEYITKNLLFSVKSTYRFACRHPFFASFAFSLFILYSCYPSLFAFLVSSSPVLSCTALLLGILLSYGEPNIPEIEEDDKFNRKVSSLKVENSVDDLLFKKDKSYTLEGLVDTRFGTEERISKDLAPDGENVRDSDFLAVSSLFEKQNKIGEEHSLERGFVEDLEVLMKEQSESQMRTSEVADGVSEGIEGLMVKINKPELDDWFDSSLGSPWQPINIHDAASDSESDRAESSSSDASMTDILPMLDELHPLLDSEAPHHAPKSADNLLDLELSQHHESDEDSVEQEDEHKMGEKDESNKVVTWTADDQKNVMDLGSSDLERNRRLESLIARRRARKNQIIIFEKDLIDLHCNDTTMANLFQFHPQIPTISAPRRNPFDLPHDLDESKGLPPIPGSAPSVLLSRQNPFDFPCDSEDGNKGLAGESFSHAEFGFPSQRGYFFRRHESFASHSAFPSNLMHEKHDSSKLNPYFVAERMDSEGNDYVDFHRKLSGKSNTKLSSVPASETVSSAIDPEDQKVPTEQGIQQNNALSVPVHYTKPTEQYNQTYKDNLVDFQSELGEDGHSVDPNASAVTQETYQGIDASSIVKKGIEAIEFGLPMLDGQNHEVVEEKHVDLTFSSEKIEKSLDISLHEILETQEQITSSVSKGSSESMQSSDAYASHLIFETEGVDNYHVAVPIYDSSPSGSGNFLANISVPDDNLHSSGRGGLHSVSSVESHVQEDAMEVVSHARVLEESMLSEVTEFEVVHGSKLQASTSSSVEPVTFSTYMNLLDENALASKWVPETGEQDFNENRSPGGFGHLATSVEIDHSSSLSSAEADNEPTSEFSVGFPPSEVEEKNQSMEELEMQTSFGTYLEESHMSNLDLGPILEESSEDFKLEEDHLSLVQTTTTFASTALQILEAPDVGLSSVGQEVVPLHNQSKEEVRDEDNEEGLAFSSEEAKPSKNSNLVSATDDMFTGLLMAELADSMEFSIQSMMKSEFTSNDDISDSQDGIINEFQINQDVILRNLNDIYSEHGDADAELREIQLIDEHLLSELDAVGDFQVQELKSQECLHMESQSASQFDCSEEDSELRSAHVAELSPNKPISANLNNPDEIHLVLNQEEPTDSGYWSLAMAPVEDITVYKPKLNVLEACSLEELDSIFNQDQPGELIEPPLSETSTDKLVAEKHHFGLSRFDMVDQEIEAIPHGAALLTLSGKNAEDIDSALLEDGRDIDISASPQADFQHNDNHSSMDGCKFDLTVVDAYGYDPAEIQSIEIKADHVESVMPSTSGLTSYASAIAEAEASSSELDISGGDFGIEETDLKLLILEAKSIENIHSASKHVTEIVVNKSISPPANPESIITHTVDNVAEAMSPEVEKASGLLVLEEKFAEDINSAFKQATQEDLTTSIFHLSDPESMRSRPDFEVMEPSSPAAENSSELFVLKARSAAEIQLAFKQFTEEVSAMPTSPLIDPESSKTKHDHEVMEATHPVTHNNTEFLFPEAKISEDVDSAFEQADMDLVKPPSPVDMEKTITHLGEGLEVAETGSVNAKNDTEPLVVTSTFQQATDQAYDKSFLHQVYAVSLGTRIDNEVVDVKSLETQIDPEPLILDAIYVEDIDSSFKPSSEGGLLRSTSHQIDPDHDAVKDGSLQASTYSELLVLEAESVEETSSTLKQVIEGAFDKSSPLVDPEAAGTYEVANVISLGAENDSDMLSLETKSFHYLNSAIKQDIEADLAKPTSQHDSELGNFHLDHDAVEETSFKEAAADLFGQSTIAIVDPGHNPRQEVLVVKSPDSGNISDFPVLEANSLEDLNLAFRQAIEGCLSKASSKVDAEHGAVGESCLAADKNSELIVLEEKSTGNIQSAFSDANAGVHVGSSSLPVDPEPMETHPGHEVEDNICFEAENNSKMLVIEAKSLDDINSAFRQATDVATSPLLLDAKSLDIDSASSSLVLEAKSVELTDSALKQVHQEGSNKSTFFTDPPSLQVNSDDDFMEESSIGKNDSGSVEDIDSTFTRVTEGYFDRPFSLQDDSKQTETRTKLEHKDSEMSIPEPKSITDGNVVVKQVTEESNKKTASCQPEESSPEVINQEVEGRSGAATEIETNEGQHDSEFEYARETIVAFDKAVTGENSSSEYQINIRADGEKASSEDPTSKNLI